MPAVLSSLLADYPAPAGVWDEMMSGGGTLRPHWERLAASLNKLGVPGLTSCAGQARQSIAENGVTYNVYGDPRGMDRPWEFDPVPFVIPPHEWAVLEKGLIQRARLVNAVLSDLYGPQTLLREGALPPGIVLGNPAYQFACQGLRPSEDTWLHLYAVDLARGPDGGWWCFADRTQAPSGSGYVLENRIVLSRSMPDEIRDLQVQRLSGFYRIFRENLLRHAPRRSGADGPPRVVLLTPGPMNETYFEHAYLSRYLGFPLVEGGDLTVRDRRVFLKTLEGLQPVDVIFRRVDDSFCDPLELRQDSFLGVPGLLEAMREGNVSVANPIGSGLAESPALMAFLPALCKRLLGQELLLPNTATWWCGQRKEREHVIANLDDFVIKAALSDKSSVPVFPSELSGPEKAKLIARIRKDPHQFVGQEKITLSEAPVWTGSGLKPRPIALRVYLAAAGDSFMVMPGGLTRVSVSPTIPIVSMQSGGGSKDTWVLADGPVSHQSLLTPGPQRRAASPTLTDLPSRVADNLFWLGRYAERAEILVRLMRVLITRLTDDNVSEGPETTGLLMRLLVPLEIIPKAPAKPLLLEKYEQEALNILFKKDRPGGLHTGLSQLRRAAWLVRDRLSLDTWRILTELQQELPPEGTAMALDDSLGLLNRLIRSLSAFAGMVMENMTRGHGWRFLDLGRRLERSSALLLVVREALKEDPAGQYLLMPLLDIADSAMTYRRRYFAHAQRDAVLELLLTDESNPRSAHFQIQTIREHLAHLPPMPGRSNPGAKHRMTEELSRRLRALDAEAAPETLTPVLTELVASVWQLSDRLAHVYFSHAGARIS
ncbi:MAG: circularly permuted type 2 ATP-grasp protein [Verrucomicrobiota bacterium]